MAILKKINSIENLGLYNNYAWDSNLPDFKQYNVIYGWNGTGKTTLSKLLWALNSGNHSDFPSLKYSVQDADSKNYVQGVSFDIKVRVFNSDFITDNINFDTQDSKAIKVLLGKENKEISDQIEADKQKIKEIKRDLDIAEQNYKKAINARSSKFTDIARIISQGSRNYNKSHAESEFNKLNEKELLGDATLEKLFKSVSQKSLQEKSCLSLDGAVDNLANDIIKAKTILKTTVEAVVIERLKENPDISAWVENGLKLRKKHCNEICDFCGQSIQMERINELTAHFNEADAKLKTEIDEFIEKLQLIRAKVDGLDPIDKMNLYQELQSGYEVAKNKLIFQQKLAVSAIDKFVKLIESKKQHTTEIMELKDVPVLDDLVKLVKKINDIISEHNKKTNDFEAQLEKNNKKIERHFLSTIYDEVNELNDNIKTTNDEKIKLKCGINGDDKNIGLDKLEKRVEENSAKISSKHNACKLLNEKIKTFLGHNEITFAISEDHEGYKIFRCGEPAKSLSEGERTAIAFVFFIIQLNDNFDIKNGIVVIDDPVSSLDANSQFQAFSFLKNATMDASQLFLFTHNFDFLKLALYWLKNKKNSSLYMVKNTFSTTNNSRVAYIDQLDSALERFESEYFYLFNIVYNYKSDGTIENAYKMPNIARKLLESFLMFRVPKSGNTYDRLHALEFDEEKKMAIYKFINDQSHITGSGFDPALVPGTQKCAEYLIELIEKTFEEHYNFLIKEISKNSSQKR